MVSRSSLLLLVLFSTSLAQDCTTIDKSFVWDPYKPVYLQNGKTKSSSSGNALAWLAKYMLPVPRSAYRADQVDYHTNLQNNINNLLWDVDWWKYYLECINDTAIYTELDLGYCNSDYLANGSCKNNEYVGLPLYIEQDLNEWAQLYFPNNSNPWDSWGTFFMTQANQSKPRSVQKELDKQRANLTNQATSAYYGIIGDYLGVGFNVKCRDHISQTINNADQFDTAGWQAATTLMALIPVLLTFGNLFVVRSSGAFGTSFIVGTMSAVFSLGLPVRSISGIREKQRVTVNRFEFLARHTIAVYGKPAKRSKTTGEHAAAATLAKIEDIQQWSTEPPTDAANTVLTRQQRATDCAFGDIRRRSLKWSKRNHMWHVNSFVVAVVQGVLFMFTIGPLFVGFGTPLLLFDCHNYWTSLWLLVSAAVSALVRLVMWETGAHERVKLFALSNSSITSLRHLIQETKRYTPESSGGYLLNTVETQLPPLHPALLTSIGHSLYRIWSRTAPKFLPDIVLRYQSTRREDAILLDKPAYVRSRTRIRLQLQELYTMARTVFLSPARFFHSGVTTTPKHTAPMRYRPLMILMHLSTEGRHPLVTLFTGVVEGVILIVLTVFFGASWGGNLLVLCYVMAVILVTISLGRALGLWYVVRSAKLFGLHVIETQSPRQIIGCLRILCSMQAVLVFVNSAWYFEGHRLDERQGWVEWKIAYERGEFDENLCAEDGRKISVVSDKPPKLSIGSDNVDGSVQLVSPVGSIPLPRISAEQHQEYRDEEMGIVNMGVPRVDIEDAGLQRSSTANTEPKHAMSSNTKTQRQGSDSSTSWMN